MIAISVIIATYNRSEDLKNVLDRLQKQEFLDYEVLIIDNNSTDNTKSVVEVFIPLFQGRLKYFFEPRQGKPFALNRGVKEAGGAIIVLTDDDCIVENSYLAQIHKTFQDNGSTVGFIGGRIYPRWVNCSKPGWFDNLKPEWFKEFFWGPLAILDYGDKPFIVNSRHLGTWDLKLFYGANMAVRKEFFLKYGLNFQTRLVEDTELQLRLLAKNIDGLYAPQVKVYHKVTAGRLTKKHYYRWYFARGFLREDQEKYKRKFYHPLGIQIAFILKTLGFFIKSLSQKSFTKKMYNRCQGIFNLGQMVKIARRNII